MLYLSCMKSWLYLCLIAITACKAPVSFISTDKNWQNITVPDLKVPLHQMAVSGPHIWATDYGEGKLFYSPDAGKSWQQPMTFGSEYIEVIQFPDEKTGFVCGDYGFVYRSDDGGLTWTQISPPVDQRITERFRNDSTKDQEPDGAFVAYYGMHFIDGQEGFVSGFTNNPRQGFRDSFKRLLFHTRDGGQSWSDIPPPRQS